VNDSSAVESRILLGWRPDRLGHATFLSRDHIALFFSDVPKPGIGGSSKSNANVIQPWDPKHPLHITFFAAYRKHLERIQKESTESEEARQTLSFHFDVDKGARRAALKDIEALIMERGAYKPCIEICLSSNLL